MLRPARIFSLLLLLGLLSVLSPVRPAAAVGAEPLRLPVLMYHSVLKDPARQGRYTVTPAQFEADLQYLSEQGYETVTAQDLVDFVERGVPLPEKPVLLTFDDGYYNNVYYAEPLLAKYNMRATIFLVGAFCEQSTAEGEQNPNYSYVSWDEVAAMAARGVWDIQSHTWDMHRSTGSRYGIRRAAGESVEAYEAALRDDAERMIAKLTEVTGTAPVAFAYPFGFRNDRADRVLAECGFRITFGCRDCPALLQPGRLDTLVGVQRLLRSGGTSIRRLLG